ncbi:MAG: hypothetical protein JXR83_23605 [Deltaproteobacteria bacterium]|nr:hypothetical protein [Deltaproteobacteria bacterium]
MSDSGPARTMFAARAIEIHDLFAAQFRETVVGSKVPRRVVVQEIDVESTGGGHKARMSVALVPDAQHAKASFPVVAGWLDASNNSCRMRSFATVAKHFREKAGRFLELPEAEYRQFVRQVQEFLEANGFAFELYDEETHYRQQERRAKAEAALKPAAPGKRALRIALLVLLIVALGIAIVIEFILKN